MEPDHLCISFWVRFARALRMMRFWSDSLSSFSWSWWSCAFFSWFIIRFLGRLGTILESSSGDLVSWNSSFIEGSFEFFRVKRVASCLCSYNIDGRIRSCPSWLVGSGRWSRVAQGGRESQFLTVFLISASRLLITQVTPTGYWPKSKASFDRICKFKAWIFSTGTRSRFATALIRAEVRLVINSLAFSSSLEKANWWPR